MLGTGDLSELALGWSTYGVGDQMSHYNVNAGVPKTLIQHLIRWVISSQQFDDAVNAVLQSVLDTEISPELVPAGEDEEIQSSEAKVGPVRAAGLFAVPRAALRVPAVQGRLPGLARLERRAARRLAARVPARTSDRPTPSRRSGTGWRSSCSASSRSASSSARRCRTAPRCRRRSAVAARRLAGAVGHVRRTWLDEIEREVPEA